MDKSEYFNNIPVNGSRRAKLFKCFDRISNLTDLHCNIHSDQKITDYFDQTEKFNIPMAWEVISFMLIELTDSGQSAEKAGENTSGI